MSYLQDSLSIDNSINISNNDIYDPKSKTSSINYIPKKFDQYIQSYLGRGYNGILSLFSYILTISLSLYTGIAFYDGRSSAALITAEATIQLGAFLHLFNSVLFTVNNNLASNSVSIDMLILYGISFIFRLTSTLFMRGYLPDDKSGEFFYQLCEICSLILICMTIGLIIKYSEKINFFKEKSRIALVSTILIFCAVSAAIFHPHLNHNRFYDGIWTFSSYLKCFAMLPQLSQITQNRLPSFLGHFITLNSIACVISAYFWYMAHSELGYLPRYIRRERGLSPRETSPDTFHAGHVVLLFNVGNVLLSADLIWLFIRQKVMGPRHDKLSSGLMFVDV